MAENKSYKIEKDWITTAGLRAVITRAVGVMSHLCGYVGVPNMHKFYGMDYASVDADVHGGLTYSAKGEYPVESDLWWLGFDCAHAGDFEGGSCLGKPLRTLEYVVQECESLAKQLQEN